MPYGIGLNHNDAL